MSASKHLPAANMSLSTMPMNAAHDFRGAVITSAFVLADLPQTWLLFGLWLRRGTVRRRQHRAGRLRYAVICSSTWGQFFPRRGSADTEPAVSPPDLERSIQVRESGPYRSRWTDAPRPARCWGGFIGHELFGLPCHLRPPPVPGYNDDDAHDFRRRRPVLQWMTSTSLVADLVDAADEMRMMAGNVVGPVRG